MEEIMELGIKEARNTMNENKGGPFGAVITDKNGKVICVASNLVLENHDENLLKLKQIDREKCLTLFDEYLEKSKEIY